MKTQGSNYIFSKLDKPENHDTLANQRAATTPKINN